MKPEEVVTLFPGSVEEYERFRGYDVEIVDTGRKGKFVFASERDRSLLFQLIDADGVEALVNLAFVTEPPPYRINEPYGLPVRRKRKF